MGTRRCANEGLNYEITDIPGRLKERAKAALAELIDAVSNKDDDDRRIWCSKKSRLTPPVLKAAIRRLTCKIELVPVLCGSAFKKKGVQVLVDAVVDYLPSPLDVPGAEGLEPGTENKVQGRDRTTTTSSARWRSSFGPILTRASWCSSAFIPASSRRATPFTIRARANASASAASWSFKAANARTSTRFMPATSPRWSACATSPPATRCATKILT